MSHLLATFHKVKFITKIDLCGAYYLVQIAKGHKHLTASNTWHGSFEYLVMPFGLTNAPTTFRVLINKILGDLVNKFLVVYLEDILIYSKKSPIMLDTSKKYFGLSVTITFISRDQSVFSMQKWSLSPAIFSMPTALPWIRKRSRRSYTGMLLWPWKFYNPSLALLILIVVL